MTERIASPQPGISGSAWGWNQAEAIMNDSMWSALHGLLAKCETEKGTFASAE